MKTAEAAKYFGNKTKLARALGCWHTTISSWGEYPPLGRQYQIQALTNGALTATQPIQKPEKEPTHVCG